MILTPRRLAVFALALSGILSPRAAGADGDLDPAFYGDGTALFSDDGDSEISTAVAAPDGALVVIGTRLVTTRGAWWRFADGEPAIACLLDPTASLPGSRLLAASFDGDGRLVVAGGFMVVGGGWKIGLARYLYPACALDPSFDGNGLVDLDVPHDDWGEEATAVAVHSSGLIVVAGRLNGVGSGGPDTDLLVALFTEAGAPVPLFSGNGWLQLDLSGDALDDEPVGVAIDDALRIVVAAQREGSGGGDSVWMLLAFDLDGEPSTTFGGGDGRASVTFGGAHPLAPPAFARDPNGGALLLAGTTNVPPARSQRFARFLADGSPDLSFSGDGQLSFTYDVDNVRLSAVAIDDLGRIVAGATSFGELPQDADFVALRVARDGTIDSTFGSDGTAIVPVQADGSDQLRGIALSPGRFWLGGRSQNFANWDVASAAALRMSLLFADGFERGSRLAWSSAAP